MGETETVISSRTRGQEAYPTEVSARSTVAEPAERRSKTALIVLLTAVLTLLVFGVAGLGYWIYMRQREKEDARVAPNNRLPVPTATVSDAKPTPTPSPTPNPTSTKTPVDRSKITREVTDAISSWKEDTESGDVDAVTRHYADRVDYFNRGGVGRDFIGRDKERAFSDFDSIDINIANVKVDVDDTGESATAEFDKSWQFVGDRVSEGKVRSQLKLKKSNGKWIITSERDLRVY